jgi:hypothetical protein
VLWRLKRQAEALALSERALVLARSIPRLEEHLPDVVLAGSTLRQHGVFLAWTADAQEADARQVLQEAASLLSWAVAKAPERVASVGEYADVLLELGDAAAARVLLHGPLRQGAGGEYRASYLLACLLSGEYEEIRRFAPDVLRGRDPQESLAVALARVMTDAPAGDALHQVSQTLSEGGVQWPRGALLREVTTRRPTQAEALMQFIHAFEAAYGADDTQAQMNAVEQLKASVP